MSYRLSTKYENFDFFIEGLKNHLMRKKMRNGRQGINNVLSVKYWKKKDAQLGSMVIICLEQQQLHFVWS